MRSPTSSWTGSGSWPTCGGAAAPRGSSSPWRWRRRAAPSSPRCSCCARGRGRSGSSRRPWSQAPGALGPSGGSGASGGSLGRLVGRSIVSVGLVWAVDVSQGPLLRTASTARERSSPVCLLLRRSGAARVVRSAGRSVGRASGGSGGSGGRAVGRTARGPGPATDRPRVDPESIRRLDHRPHPERMKPFLCHILVHRALALVLNAAGVSCFSRLLQCRFFPKNTILFRAHARVEPRLLRARAAAIRRPPHLSGAARSAA